MADKTTSAEQALAELREMFPDGAEIKYMTDTNWPVEILGYGKTTANTRYQLAYRYGKTLTDVMDQVRQRRAGKERVLMSTKRKPAEHGYRITLTMEAPNAKMMRWALAQGFTFAREQWIGVTVSHKDEPRARVSCRTTRLRKPKANSQ